MNTTDLLPPMPTPDLWMPWRVVNAPDGSVHSAGYTADQMRAYAEAAAAEERKRWERACDAERAEFAERAANNDGSRQSDFAFGSVNSAERIKAAGVGPNVKLTGTELID